MATIAEEINDLKSRVNSAYDVCELKGATIPQDKTTWNLSSTIESIPSSGEMPKIFGIPISTYVPINQEGEYNSLVNLEDTNEYCLSVTGSIRFGNDFSMLKIKKLLGIPGTSFSIYDKTSILSVIFNNVEFHNTSNDLKYAKQQMNSFADQLFAGVEYKYVSFPDVTKGFRYRTNSTVNSNASFDTTFHNTKIDKLDLPLYSYDNINFIGSQIGELYAPNLSSVGNSFMKDNNSLSSCTIYKHQKGTSFTSFFENCSSLSSLPIESISTNKSTISLLSCNFLAKGMTALSSVNLSIETAKSTSDITIMNAFANCTSLTGAVIHFNNLTDETGLKMTSGTKRFNNMFAYCPSLEKVELRGITSIGSINDSTTYIGFVEIMNNTSANSQLWFPDVDLLTGAIRSSTIYQRFQNLGCKDLYFPKVSDIKNRYLFGGIGEKTTGIHFAAEHKDALTATAGYKYKWTAPDTCTIYFDL